MPFRRIVVHFRLGRRQARRLPPLRLTKPLRLSGFLPTLLVRGFLLS